MKTHSKATELFSHVIYFVLYQLNWAAKDTTDWLGDILAIQTNRRERKTR